MYCGNCGRQNLDDSVFCEGCGQPLESVPESFQETAQVNKCQSCQMEIPEDIESCPYCGNGSSPVEKPTEQRPSQTPAKKRKAIFIIIPILLVLIVAVAVVIKIAFFNDSSEEASVEGASVVETEEQATIAPATIAEAMHQAEEASLLEEEEQEAVIVASPEPSDSEEYDDLEDYAFSYEPYQDGEIYPYLVDGLILPQSEWTILTSDDIYDAIFAFEDSDGTIDGYFEEPISTYAWLGLVRNEVYARHGHHFQTGEYAKYFSQFDWYRSLDKKTVTYEDLSGTEQKNVSLLKDVSEAFLGDFDINGYIFSFSSDREITDEELEIAISNAAWDEFEYMLDFALAEIFARKGILFENEALNTYYFQYEWYQVLPKTDMNNAHFNDIEERNISKIMDAMDY